MIYPSARHFISALLILCSSLARADVPVPPKVLNPTSIEEAWNVVRLATTNVEQLLKEGRAVEVADQVALCSPALRLIARSPTPGFDQTRRDDQTMRAFRSVNLMARDSAVGNQAGVEAVFGEWKKCLQELALGFDSKVISGEIYHCLDHTDVISLRAGDACSQCQRSLHPRRIPYSFVYVEQKTPTVKVTARLDGAMAPGKKITGTLRIVDLKGEPVTRDDLIVTHTQHIHLILADQSLQDYHLTQATPSETAGDYTFSFTPKMDSLYHIWVAMVPCATGLQEYAKIDLGESKSEPESKEFETSMVASVDGCQFQLTIPSGSRSVATSKAGQMQMLRLHVTDAQGKPVSLLEPFSNAFAHLTGIYEDQNTIFQLHPMGGDVINDQLRGGPDLSFKFYAPRSGNVKLFCTVRLDGKWITVPFAFTVVPQ
jgi:hypothetical protein